MLVWLSITILLILNASAYRFGRGPERGMANLLSANFVLVLLYYGLFGAPSFGKLNYTLAGLDGLTLVGMMWIALRANRMWTMVITSLQVVVMITHASVLISIGWTRVYYGMIALSQYCELISLAIGIACHYVRERRFGMYREWRRPYDPGGQASWLNQPVLRRSPEPQGTAIHAARLW